MKAMLTQILVILVLAVSVAPLRAQNVAVVMSSDASAYQEALEGFKETTRHRIVGVQTLTENPATWRDEIKKLRSTIEPDLVLVIGTSALQAVAGEITNIPIVHAMVFNPFGVANSSSKNIIGISMIPAVNQSISLLKELNPKYRRVGVIFDPIRSGPLFMQARGIAQKENIQLVAREIRSPGELAGALKSLENEIDVLWLWPDEGYLGDEILQRIFLFSFERKVPVLGLSERHTQMGAVLSLSYASAKDVGRQAGEVANRMLGEPKGPYLTVVAPRQTKLAVNLKTARKLDVAVPDSIIQRADNAVKAPLYQEGDWWLFRIKTLYPGGRSEVEDHRVTFKGGKFESEHPSFLTGGDLAGTPSFLPFASVFLNDPTRKWLDFPLLPGKSWRFSYPSASYTRSRRRWTLAVAEVIGKASKPIQTTAGAFEAIEISRHDQLNPAAFSTYFYSPQTKSVVKLKAEIDLTDPRSSGRQFELELVAYGTERKESR
jgi:putative ABC transport system substrate-binding protein